LIPGFSITRSRSIINGAPLPPKVKTGLRFSYRLSLQRSKTRSLPRIAIRGEAASLVAAEPRIVAFWHVGKIADYSKIHNAQQGKSG